MRPTGGGGPPRGRGIDPSVGPAAVTGGHGRSHAQRPTASHLPAMVIVGAATHPDIN